MRDFFNGRVLVFDGAIGTELYERGFYINRPFEELNLSAPGDVIAVHKSYVEAGAEVLTTNTFSITRPQLRKFDIEAQQGALLKAALENAAVASEGGIARIGLSIGPTGELVEPLGPFSLEEVRTEYAHVARLAQAAGVAFHLYILETFSNLSELKNAIDGIRSVDADTPILASISISGDSNRLLHDFASGIGQDPRVDAIGMNCSEGPSNLLSALKTLRPLTQKPIVVQPNAGIPQHVNGRYFYMSSPDYLAKYAKRYADAGASGVGGCCGTGPIHVQAIHATLRMTNARLTSPMRIETGDDASGEDQTGVQARRKTLEERDSEIGHSIRSGKKVFSVEVSSPKGTDLTKFMDGLDRMIAAGVSFVNVPDGPRASARISSLHLAAAVRHSGKKISVLPHFTTRDRNLIALQADLLGACVNGVRDLLLVTGDPPKLGNNKDATGVYDIDSIGLTRLVDCLNSGMSPQGEALGRGTSFGIGVAANPTATDLALERKRWGYKVDNGADFAVTQPIYDPESYLRWMDMLGAQTLPHIVGIWPFISLRNAEFMANEVPGVKVPTWALEEMAKAGDDKEEAIKRGVDIARRTMSKLNEACAGFAVSAPLGKVEVALRVLTP